MKYQLATIVAIGCLLASGTARAQTCPNWSPKFDQITNSEVKQKLRNTNWDQAIQSAGGPEPIVASFKASRKDAQQRLDNAARAAEETKGYPGPVRYDVTWEQCRNNNKNAHMAAVCEHLNMSELILTLDGSIDLVKCRENQSH